MAPRQIDQSCVALGQPGCEGGIDLRMQRFHLPLGWVRQRGIRIRNESHQLGPVSGKWNQSSCLASSLGMPDAKASRSPLTRRVRSACSSVRMPMSSQDFDQDSAVHRERLAAVLPGTGCRRRCERHCGRKASPLDREVQNHRLPLFTNVRAILIRQLVEKDGPAFLEEGEKSFPLRDDRFQGPIVEASLLTENPYKAFIERSRDSLFPVMATQQHAQEIGTAF